MITNKKNGQRGAALVEFTLIIPLLLLFLFGLIEFSIILYDKAVVTNASREVARAWITYRDDANKYNTASLQAIVDTYTVDRLISFGPENLTMTTDPPGSTGPIGFSRGDNLKVTLEYEYDFLLLPGLAQSLLPTLTLKADTIMRAE